MRHWGVADPSTGIVGEAFPHRQAGCALLQSANGVFHSKSGLTGGLGYKRLSVAIGQPVAGEKAVINTLVGAEVTGTGMLPGKPVQFKCVLVGDRDKSKPNTLVVIVVASEGAMKRQSGQIVSALDSVRAQDAQ
jgi:hypothetical protein